MIKNNNQLAAAKEKLSALEGTIDSIQDPVEREPYEELADSIRTEIETFEAIAAGRVDAFYMDSLDELTDALVKIRLAKGWTQRQLAERLEVAEQQVQRFESGGYQNSSFYRLADVVDALEYEFCGYLMPRSERCTFIHFEGSQASSSRQYQLLSLYMDPNMTSREPEPQNDSERGGYSTLKDYNYHPEPVE